VTEEFLQRYEAAEAAIRRADKPAAKAAYKDALAAYKQMSSVEKKASYDQLTQLHQDINGMSDAHTTHSTESIPEGHAFGAKDFIIVGVFLILVAFVLMGDPKTIGFATVETNAPVWSGVREFTATQDNAFILDLSTAFRDPDGDELTFLVSGAPGVQVSLRGSVVTMLPQSAGTFTVTVMASDATHVTKVPLTIQVT
jgi:hypothetical protein